MRQFAQRMASKGNNGRNTSSNHQPGEYHSETGAHEEGRIKNNPTEVGEGEKGMRGTTCRKNATSI